MSYIALDVNVYLGDVASLGGWAEFANWARTLAAGRPALEALLDNGWAEAPGLIADLEAVTATGDAESTRLVLLALARKADEILIITDGVGTEEA